jgi:hypothetical protein
MPEIPATHEAEIRRVAVQSQPKQKVIEVPISTNQLCVMVHACHPSYEGGGGRRIAVWHGQKVRPYPKIN